MKINMVENVLLKSNFTQKNQTASLQKEDNIITSRSTMLPNYTQCASFRQAIQKQNHLDSQEAIENDDMEKREKKILAIALTQEEKVSLQPLYNNCSFDLILQPGFAEKLFDFVAKQDDFTQRSFVLLENSLGLSLFSAAVLSKQPEIAEKFLDLVEKQTPHTKWAFSIIQDNYDNNSQFNIALYQNQPELASKFLDFIAKQNKITQELFALFSNKKGDSQFNVALYNNQPELASTFLDFVAKQDKSTQGSFALLTNKNGDSQFNVALDQKQPELASKFLDFVAKQDDYTQARFLFTRKNYIDPFRHTTYEEQPELASKILDLLAKQDKDTQREFLLLKSSCNFKTFNKSYFNFLHRTYPELAKKFASIIKNSCPEEFPWLEQLENQIN